MKTLMILRHAKSSWKEEHLSDHDRPLNKRGRRDAPKMGELIGKKGLQPQLIICSGAKRARETVELVTSAFGYKGELRFSEELYAAASAAYISVLKELDDRYERVMVVGHNPGLEEMLEGFTKEEQTLPTAALAQVALPIQKWQELKGSTDGRLTDLWVPRQLSE
ncbi:histidine phosphatase family protein [bacterium]|nr:histidine phosphatase family protein [bacterium]